MLSFPEYPDSELNYLNRADVLRACAEVDICAVVERALRAHAAGDCILPDEAYLGWRTESGHSARSLAMPGAIREEDGIRLGMKVINGSLGNPAKGIARSQGLLMLFDPEIAWPHTLMEAAYVSAMRTAAVTAISAAYLGPESVRGLALLGCGTLARAHLTLLKDTLPKLDTVHLYDIDPERSREMAESVRAELPRLEVVVAEGPRECVANADLVVPVTIVTEGYLEYDWFKPGALISHVSLDDVLPEVVRRSGLIVVDDWNLVCHDDKRLLGRMYREGQLLGPGGEHPEGLRPVPGVAAVDTTLGDVVSGKHPGRMFDDEIVLSNPFGMSILDVALGSAVAAAAEKAGIGHRLPR